MNSLRQFSSSWKGTPPTTDREQHEVKRRHRLSGHEKNYDVLPLGGNRPISISVAASGKDLDNEAREQRRHHRRTHRHHHHRSPTGSPDSKASRSSSSSLASDSQSSRSSGRSSDSATGPHRVRSSAIAHGGVSIRPATAANRDEASSTLPTSSSSPPKIGSSMGIVLSEGRKRRGSNDSRTEIPLPNHPITCTADSAIEASTPYIMATPPTPSPLEKARMRNMQALETPLNDPPYPMTPPISEPGEYVAYSPTSPTVRAPTSPIIPPTEVSPPSPPPVEIGSSDSVPQQRAVRSAEDPYELLQRFDTVFIVDDSGSMKEHWSATRNALETVATVALKHDRDGVDIHFMNNPRYDAWNVKSATHVRQLFNQVRPSGVTPTGQCLDEILRDYLDRYISSKIPGPDGQQQPKIKPLNIVVITDGEPTDDVESVIVSVARKLERLNAPLHQVGIQFLQIGDGVEAREALEELDDALAGIFDIRDMVDTTQFVKEGEQITGKLLLKALLGGVNRIWDRREM